MTCLSLCSRIVELIKILPDPRQLCCSSREREGMSQQHLGQERPAGKQPPAGSRPRAPYRNHSSSNNAPVQHSAVAQDAEHTFLAACMAGEQARVTVRTHPSTPAIDAQAQHRCKQHYRRHMQKLYDDDQWSCCFAYE